MRLAAGEPARGRAWNSYVDTLLRDGQLDLGGLAEDTQVGGARHERLVAAPPRACRCSAAKSCGSSTDDGVVSVFGRLYEDVAGRRLADDRTRDRGGARTGALWNGAGTAAVASATLGVLPTR